MSKALQTRANHLRFDPYFHFSLVPISFAFAIWSGWVHFHQKTIESFFVWMIFLLMIGFLIRMRTYSLRVQDRVIRLEERLRLQALGDETLRLRIADLTESQLVALRFASDGEVAGLAHRSLEEGLSASQIKNAIQVWRGDYFRV